MEKNKIAYIIIAVLALVIIGGGVWYFVNDKDNKDKVDNDTSTQTGTSTSTNQSNYKHENDSFLFKFTLSNGKLNAVYSFDGSNIDFKTNLPDNVKYFTKSGKCDGEIYLVLTEDGNVYYFDTAEYDVQDTEGPFVNKKELNFEKVNLNGHTIKDITTKDVKFETDVSCFNKYVFVVDETSTLRVIDDDYKVGRTYDEFIKTAGSDE